MDSITQLLKTIIINRFAGLIIIAFIFMNKKAYCEALDYILNVVYEHDIEYTTKFKNIHNPTPEDAKLEKEIADKYVNKIESHFKDICFNYNHLIFKVKYDGYVDSHDGYSLVITPKGIDFIMQGGYIQQQKDKISEKKRIERNERWLISGAWGLIFIEILTHWKDLTELFHKLHNYIC